MSAELKTINQQAIGQRLDNYLVKNLKGVPRSLIYRIIRKGSVRVNKGRKKVYYKLQLGDVVRIPPVKTSTAFTSEISTELVAILKKNILYEDEDLLVLNKPSGLSSHSGSSTSAGVIEVMRQIYGNCLGLVHRLDRGTSGCILLAKNHLTLIKLQTQFKNGRIGKQYWALLHQTWSKKTYNIDAPLLRISTSGSSKIKVDSKGDTAISNFKPLKNINVANYQFCIANIITKTGRMHQIRVHAQYSGHPVVGDDKYGNKNINKLARQLGIKRLCLHAQILRFTHPATQKILTISAPVDKNLLDIIAKIG